MENRTAGPTHTLFCNVHLTCLLLIPALLYGSAFMMHMRTWVCAHTNM